MKSETRKPGPSFRIAARFDDRTCIGTSARFFGRAVSQSETAIDYVLALPGPLIRNPRRHALFQDVQRQWTFGEHGIVEIPDVVLCAEFTFCLLAQFENLHLA